MVNNPLERGDIAMPAHVRGTLSANEAAHLDSLLMAELSNVNYQLSLYVLKHHDADAGRAAPTPVAEEQALAVCLSKAADAIQARAERRTPEVPSDDLADGARDE